MFVFQITSNNFFIKPTILGLVINFLTAGFIMEYDREPVGDNFYFRY